MQLMREMLVVKVLGTMVLLAMLAGCANPFDGHEFGRLDCRTAVGGETGTQFQLDRQICLGRADATSARRDGTNWNVRHGYMVACMGERGYLYAPRSEHVARCSRLQTARPPQADRQASAAPASRAAAVEAPPSSRCEGIADETERLACFLSAGR